MIHSNDFGTASALAAVPAFFAEPRLLSTARHGALGVRRSTNLRYAAGLTHAPLGLDEFGQAMRSYPILFTAGPAPRPIAMLGLPGGSNGFVDALGGWRRDHYVPGCLHRYPLAAIEDANSGWQLCADFASGRVVTMSSAVEHGVEPIFQADGAPSRYTRAVIARAQIAARRDEEAVTLARALLEAGILTPCEAPLPVAEATALRQSFLMISEDAFRALSATLLAEFARLGWLEPIVMAAVSRHNWPALSQLCTRDRAGASARVAA